MENLEALYEPVIPDFVIGEVPNEFSIYRILTKNMPVRYVEETIEGELFRGRADHLLLAEHRQFG